MAETKNLFTGGMQMDLDKMFQAKDSARISYNGRIITNVDKTYSWENQYGNVVGFTIKPDNGNDNDRYLPIGWVAEANFVILFLKSNVGTNSEIGMVSLDKFGYGIYRTLFNDVNDVNNELLEFDTTNGIKAKIVWETENAIRCYWCDGVATDSNELRSITLSYDSSIGPRTDVNAYTLESTSVHSMNVNANFRMGLVKYVQKINGGLLSGVYQYSYRLGLNVGYVTPFVPLTKFIFITSDQQNNTDWNLYEMEGSGLATNKGNRIQVKGIDQRYDYIEVAYLFSETNSTPTEAKVFLKTQITSDNMEFDHSGNVGTPFSYQEFKELFITLKAKTIEIKDQVLYAGNVAETNLFLDPELIFQNLVIEPYFKQMRSDDRVPTDYPLHTQEGSITSPPVTNQSTRTGTTTKNLYDGQTETYIINDDYVNYKGTQVVNLYGGNFRGETYRLCIIAFDLKGFPTSAYHLCDFSFPEQYQDDYSWIRIREDNSTVSFSGTASNRAWPTNSYGDVDYTGEDTVLDGDDELDNEASFIRLLGLKVSGIDFSAYQSKISGFMFAVCERDKTILVQGLVYPTHRDGSDSRPFASYHQRWQISGSDFYDVNCFIGRAGAHGDRFYSRPNLFNLYAPDCDFDSSRIPKLQTSDRLRIVGSAWQGDSPDYSVYFTDTDPGVGQQSLQKLYRTKNTYLDVADYANGYPAYGDQTDMSNIFVVGINGEVSNYSPGLNIKNSIEIFDHYKYAAGTDNLYGAGKWNTLFIQTGNWGASPNGHMFNFADDGAGNTSTCAYQIVNYVRDNSNPYGGQNITALVNSIFYNVGHFIPVNNPSFSDPAGYVYDNCEFWGGDCYLDYIGFMRIYPEYSKEDEIDNNDVSYGVVFPLESEFIHSMRQAATSGDPIYTHAGARPKREWNGSSVPNWPDGLFHYSGNSELIEEFNLNSVLLYKDVVWLLGVLDPSYVLSDKYPARWRYTLPKIYGDTTDVFRRFQVNDFRDVEGVYGHIMGSASLFNQIYSLQESAVGRLRASDRAMIEGAVAGTLSTGVGDRLDGIDYITTDYGCQHQWSIISSSKAFYWIDVNLKSFFRFAQDGILDISKEKKLNDFSQYILPQFQGIDSPYEGNGILGYIDYDNGEVGWSFSADLTFIENQEFTLTNNLSDSNSLYRHHVLWNGQCIMLTVDTPITPGNGMYLPEGNTIYGYLDLFQFYIKFIADEDLEVYTMNSLGVVTLIGTLTSTGYYRFFRNKIDEPWQMASVIRLEGHSIFMGITYNEEGNFVSSIQPVRPSFFFWHKNALYATSFYDVTNNDMFYMNHGDVGNFWNGELYRAFVNPVINEAGDVSKVFDVMRLNCNKNTDIIMGKVEMYTENQGYYITYFGDTRKQYREGIAWMPYRTKTQTDRMVGKSMEVSLSISNLQNIKATISSLTSEFRISNKK
jgi:hypothetical protein